MSSDADELEACDGQATPSGADEDAELADLLATIFHTYHYDFRSYAAASLKRRVRAALIRLGCESVPVLRRRIQREPKLFTQLLRFLTVQVTDLFRDPAYFKAIREHVVPYLQTYPSLKIWVAGCATGEEAYSFAILLAEAGLLDRSLIYATDINAECLREAEAGVYDVERFSQFSDNYRLAGGTGSLSSYYTARYESAVFDRSLRKAILFSDHSLATDTAFAEVELVSCRNVLIYFERELQNRAVGLIRDSLCRKGFLGLGMKETLRFTDYVDDFVPVSAEHRLYQRV